MNIGENIRKFRKVKGLTQSELGELIGKTGVSIMRYEKEERVPSFTQSTITQYETGVREPQLSTIEAIALALDVTVPELLGYVTPTLEHTEPDITQFTTEELLKEIVRRIL